MRFSSSLPLDYILDSRAILMEDKLVAANFREQMQS
jgi:hypothetical protein